MIINVDGDPVIKLKIYLVCGGVFVVLSIYAFLDLEGYEKKAVSAH